MASVYKRKRRQQIPENAEIVTFRRKPCVAWRDGRGRRQRAPLSEDGQAIVVEAKYYTIEYFDHEGQRRREGTRIADKDAARQLANKLEVEAEQRRRGLVDARQERLAVEGRRSLESHLTNFKAKMETADCSADHVSRTARFVRTIAEAAGFATIGDITADGVNTFASELRQRRSARTVQAYLTAIKGFTRWLTANNKLPADPLASVQKPNPKTDRRRERRMLLPDEWQWLRSVAMAEGAERFGMTAAERVLLYATAIQTGLRSGELRTLTRGRLFLETEPPYIICKAGSTKNAKDARQYIQADLAVELRQHVATKAPGALVFDMPHETNVAEILRVDLADARREWLRAARHNAEECARRQESDFLVPVNHEGETLDFHSLRHTCGAWLAMTGAHPKEVQAVMRHSSIILTMDTYGHLFPGAEAEAVARLPNMLAETPEARRATGTADARPATPPERVRAQNGAQLDGKSCTPVASRGETAEADDEQPACPNVLPIADLGECEQVLASGDDSRPGGSRTPDPGIMSPLL